MTHRNRHRQKWAMLTDEWQLHAGHHARRIQRVNLSPQTTSDTTSVHASENKKLKIENLTPTSSGGGSHDVSHHLAAGADKHCSGRMRSIKRTKLERISIATEQNGQNEEETQLPRPPQDAGVRYHKASTFWRTTTWRYETSKTWTRMDARKTSQEVVDMVAMQWIDQ